MLASPVLPVPAPAGGAQAIAADLAAGLAGRGHDVVVYCAEGSNVPGVELRTVPVPEGAARALVMPGGGQPQRTPAVREAFDRMFTMLRRDPKIPLVGNHPFAIWQLQLKFVARHGLPGRCELNARLLLQLTHGSLGKRLALLNPTTGRSPI